MIVAAIDPSLRHRWFELCNRQKIPAKMEMWQAISTLYTDPARAYHNLDHIADCLLKLDQWPNPIANKDVIELALWFHDIIYDTKRTDNEAASAGLVKHYLGDHPSTESVFSHILATRHHASEMTESEYILCDIDLSILGSQQKGYNDYSYKIRSEYSWVPQDMFLGSRIKVLQSFINREFIYYTQHYRERLEGYARANIIAEIHDLKEQLQKIQTS